MDGSNSFDAPGVRLNEAGVSRAAADLLVASSERRKRGRPPTVPDRDAAAPPCASPQQRLESERKRRQVGAAGAGVAPPAVNVPAAKRAAAALLRESPTYKRLIDVEEQVDLAIMRKQQDIKDALKTNTYTRPCTFRLYVFNTFRSQAKDADASDSDSSSPGDDVAGSDVPGGGENDGSVGGDAGKGGDKDKESDEADVDVPSWSLRLQGHFVEVEETPAPVSGPGGSVGPDSAKESPAGGKNADGGPGAPGSDVRTGEAAAEARATPASVAGANTGPSRFGPTGSEQAVPPVPKRKAPTHLKCTDVFRKVVVELDKDAGYEKNLIEWNRAVGEPSADGFEISRGGDKECKARIFLYIDNAPERFKLSYVLSRLIGVRTDTRSNVFMAVWQYIKKKTLQCQDDRLSIRVDSGLQTLMPASHATVETIKLNNLFEVVRLHLGPPDPVQLEYTIKLSGNVVENQACYDIQVEVPDDTLHESAKSAGIFGLTFPQSDEFVALNEKHLEALELVAYHKRRRNFLEEFCASPVGFINQLILSQTRDLKVINGSSGRNPEEERWATFYQQQWVNEAVPRYLLRKQIADAAKKTAEQPGFSR